MVEISRDDGRTPNQLRPLACSRNVLHRAHGSASWSQGDTKVLAAVYGPKAGTKKNENPEKACIEVIWKPKTGQIGKLEKEYEMILKRTLQGICILTINPNTTTSVIIQVVHDDGALLTCAINAACAALVDAGIPLRHLAVAICCCLAEGGYVILDPTKLEEQKMKGFAYLVFPNSIQSVLPQGSALVEGEPIEHGILTSVTHGVMSGYPLMEDGLSVIIKLLHLLLGGYGFEQWKQSLCKIVGRRLHTSILPKGYTCGMLRVEEYLKCLDRGRAACAKLSDFFRKVLKVQLPSDSSKSG